MIFLYWFLFWIHFPILLFWAICGLIMAYFGGLLGSKPLKVFGRRLAIGADQMGNAFAAGFPDETLSSRVGRAIATGRPTTIAIVLKVVINKIFFWEKDHVKDAIEVEENFDFRYEPWPWTHWSPKELDKKDKVA